MGYYMAGFEVMGIDVKKQPSYPFDFVHGDALEYLADATFLSEFDAVAASPPCQPHTKMRHLAKAQGRSTRKADLIEVTRELLVASGLPWVMENVEGAPLIDPVMVCGSMFDPMLGVRRHRLFESNVPLTAPGPCRHFTQGRAVGVYGARGDKLARTTAKTLAEAQEAMGISWMVWDDLKEAVPPAYTHHLGLQLIEAIPDVTFS